MPAFTFEKISPPLRRGPLPPIAKKQRGVIVQILDRFVEARVKRKCARRRVVMRQPPSQENSAGFRIFQRQPCAATGCSSLRSGCCRRGPVRARDRRRSRLAPDAAAARQDDQRRRRQCRAIGVAICRSGLARMLASTRSNGPRCANSGAAESGGADRLHQIARAIEPRVVARDRDRQRIDVARQHRSIAAPWPPLSPARRCRCRGRARAAGDAPSARDRAAAGSRAWCRGGRCRTPAPPRSRCRACWAGPWRGRAGRARRSARRGPGPVLPGSP